MMYAISSRLTLMTLKPQPPASHTLLQVDVEGSELEVLQGVQPSDWANIQQVCQ